MGFINTPERPRDEDLPGDLSAYRFDSREFFEALEREAELESTGTGTHGREELKASLGELRQRRLAARDDSMVAKGQALAAEERLGRLARGER